MLDYLSIGHYFQYFDDSFYGINVYMHVYMYCPYMIHQQPYIADIALTDDLSAVEVLPLADQEDTFKHDNI